MKKKSFSTLFEKGKEFYTEYGDTIKDVTEKVRPLIQKKTATSSQFISDIDESNLSAEEELMTGNAKSQDLMSVVNKGKELYYEYGDTVKEIAGIIVPKLKKKINLP